MWQQLLSKLGVQPSRRTTRRRAKPHRFSGRRPAAFAAEQLEARWYLSADPIVQVDTNFGNFQIELLPADAPQTVANFLSYVNSGAYTDTFFHRSVQQGIGIVQAGGFTSTSPTFTSTSQFQTIPTHAPVDLEYNLPNAVGTVAMARTSDPNSATDQFFINDLDNSTTLGQTNGGGYAVFGKIVGTGMQDVISKIAALPTTAADNGVYSTLPLGPNNELVQITSMALLDGAYGTVFTDTNANGTQDSGENGVSGRTVFVDVNGSGQPGGTNPSATTDANGDYYIADVPTGSFAVKEVLPSGMVSTVTPQTVAFDTSTAAANVNLGEVVPSISGTVFTDMNGDGKLDDGEPGVANRTVFLNNDGTGAPDTNNPSTTTDANGNFSFLGLAANTYKVSEVLPANVTLSTNTQAIAVTAGQTATANLGELPSISGTVFTDANGNGKLDDGEPGVAGRTVFVDVNGSGKPDGNPTTTTDAKGNFAFSGLAADTYKVSEVLPANVTLSTNTQSIAVTAGHTATANIGELPSITGTVFNDVNVNGKFDTGEPGLAGVTVFLDVDNSGKPDAKNTSTTTDAAGHFYFTGLASGPYKVEQVIAANNATQTTTTSTVTVGSSSPPNVMIGDALTSTIVPLPVGVNTQTPPSNANDAYVDEVYFNLLGRHAQTSELTFWQQKMSGGETRAAVAAAVWSSAEHRGIEVDQFYHTYLNRDPDADGGKFWINRFQTTDLTERQTVEFFISSPEFQGEHKDNSDYISALYQDVLSRPASTSDQTYWQSAMSGGMARDKVAAAIINGTEASTDIVDAYFSNFLHRAADSTAQDLITALAANKTTAEGAGVGVLSTSEYFGLAGGA